MRHLPAFLVPLVLCSLALGVTVASRADASLDPLEIVKVMNARRLVIRKLCYETHPAKADTEMKVEFTVGSSGVVIDAKAPDASGPPAIIACVLDAVKKTTFSPSDTGGYFRWPFVFKGP